MSSKHIIVLKKIQETIIFFEILKLYYCDVEVPPDNVNPS